MPFDLPEHEKMEGCKELLQDHLPYTSLSPLGGCQETVSHNLTVSDRASVLYPQNRAVAYKSTQLQSRFGPSVMEYPKTCVSVIKTLLFLCCLLEYVGQELGKLTPLAHSSLHRVYK